MDENKKITLRVNKDLYEAIRIKCRQWGLSFNSIVVVAVLKHLNKL